MTQVVSVEEIYRGWSRFSLVRFRLEDGEEVERCVEDHGAAAVVLPYDPERRVALLVSRFPCRKVGSDRIFPEAESREYVRWHMQCVRR